MENDHLFADIPSSSSGDSGVSPIASYISKDIITASIANVDSQPVPNYFRNVFLATERAARYKFSHWIRLFVYYGGVILSSDDQHLATHILHVFDEEPFENAEKYRDIKQAVQKYRDIRQAVHVNVEWIKDTIKKGCLQDDRPYRVTILPK
ncbi:DNA ligase 3 BRCT domain [Popillia japonica]|uniref:DNA ligase 3 BRCT domain n=1 Tax=Popillia japonica TaxID=7064 RepID=A0AAW1MQY7_POPJA